jgi:hypothetical protein
MLTLNVGSPYVLAGTWELGSCRTTESICMEKKACTNRRNRSNSPLQDFANLKLERRKNH